MIYSDVCLQTVRTDALSINMLLGKKNENIQLSEYQKVSMQKSSD